MISDSDFIVLKKYGAVGMSAHGAGIDDHDDTHRQISLQDRVRLNKRLQSPIGIRGPK
jgi:hypothetical protein